MLSCSLVIIVISAALVAEPATVTVGADPLAFDDQAAALVAVAVEPGTEPGAETHSGSACSARTIPCIRPLPCVLHSM